MLPSVSDDFYWTQERWGAALRCRPLEAVAPHLFTTRQLELPSAAGNRMLADALGARDAAMLSQVHGARVAVIRKGETAPAPRPEADALVSNSPEIAVAVRAADCAPILMADDATGAVAAVHAGWRGTVARVAAAALQALTREFGTQPSNLVVAIGPSIGPCCYEVGPELVDAFAAAGHERYLIDRWFRAPRDGTLRLDVAGANRDQLVLAGVPEERIHLSALCTAMHLDVLTSYRAEKEKAGRIAGAIKVA